MSPPIRDGSGSSIGSIRLGDGSEISEVRTGAGDVVFSASAIPDSATHQHKLDEGSGTTFSDSIGSIDGSTGGASWTSDSELEGGQALSLDGSDDTPSFDSKFGSVGTSNSWSFAVTINADNLNSGQVIWQQSNNTYIATIGMDTDSNGELGVQFFNGSSRPIQRGTTDGTSSRLRLGASWDTNNDTGELYIDGSEVSYNASSDFKVADTTFDGNNLGHRNSDEHFAGIIDHPIFYDEVLTSDEFSDDYNAQPWS